MFSHTSPFLIFLHTDHKISCLLHVVSSPGQASSRSVFYLWRGNFHSGGMERKFMFQTSLSLTSKLYFPIQLCHPQNRYIDPWFLSNCFRTQRGELWFIRVSNATWYSEVWHQSHENHSQLDSHPKMYLPYAWQFRWRGNRKLDLVVAGTGHLRHFNIREEKHKAHLSWRFKGPSTPHLHSDFGEGIAATANN